MHVCVGSVVCVYTTNKTVTNLAGYPLMVPQQAGHDQGYKPTAMGEAVTLHYQLTYKAIEKTGEDTHI